MLAFPLPLPVADHTRPPRLSINGCIRSEHRAQPTSQSVF